MKSRFLFFFSLCLTAAGLWAQQTFTGRVAQPAKDGTRIRIVQDAELDRLVNNLPSLPPQILIEKDAVRKQEGEDLKDSDSLIPPAVPARKVRIQGYRIQLYAGAGSREARQTATSTGLRFKRLFPQLSVYTHFVAPRWSCQAGDFKTYEEASELLKEIRRNSFPEAMIVKTTIQVPLYKSLIK